MYQKVSRKIKRNKNSVSLCLCPIRPSRAETWPMAQRAAARALCRALPRAQAATWAWARNLASRSIPPGPATVRSISAVCCNLTVARRFRSNKMPTPRGPGKTLAHSLCCSLSLCPLSIPFSATAQPSDRERDERNRASSA